MKTILSAQFARRAVLAVSLLALPIGASAAEGDTILFNRLGGMPAVRLVVDRFVDKIFADTRVNKWFSAAVSDPERAAAYKASLTTLVCQVTGGPCRYEGPDMATAHADRAITSDAFDAVVEDLTAVLDEAKVPAREKRDLLAILGGLKSAIVEKK
ncbi:MAG: group 1 truncated hemoglobin [Bryobacteraceae bacterium]